MTAEFTPGPWTALGTDFDGFDIYRRAPNEPGGLGEHIAEIDHEDATDIANARLIAAAPDLYEALEQIAAKAGRMDDIGPIAEAALKKARGEA